MQGGDKRRAGCFASRQAQGEGELSKALGHLEFQKVLTRGPVHLHVPVRASLLGVCLGAWLAHFLSAPIHIYL